MKNIAYQVIVNINRMVKQNYTFNPKESKKREKRGGTNIKKQQDDQFKFNHNGNDNTCNSLHSKDRYSKIKKQKTKLCVISKKSTLNVMTKICKNKRMEIDIP